MLGPACRRIDARLGFRPPPARIASIVLVVVAAVAAVHLMVVVAVILAERVARSFARPEVGSSQQVLLGPVGA